MLAYEEWQQLFEDGKLNKEQEQFFKARTPEALYDIEKDPHEVHNLAADPDYDATLKALRSMMQVQVKSMPDLSFYPESYFLEAGLSNPVAFGQQNKSEIAALVDIADLCLKSFDEAKEEIENALKSDNPWKRFWGLLVCSSFRKEAHPFFEMAVQMTQEDQENLVRIRAIEFLMLQVQDVPSDLILEIIKNAKSETETNLILNSIALIKTVRPDFRIDIPKSMFPSDWVNQEGDLVNRRVDFINKDN